MGLFLRPEQEPPTPGPESRTPRNRARSAPWNAPRGITASAERLNLADAQPVERPYVAWQREAWNGYLRVGEIHYGFNLLANLLARVRIYAAVLGESNEPPLDVTTGVDKKRVKRALADDAREVMAELQAEDWASSTRAFALNFSVAGECYLLQLPRRDGGPLWTIRSVDEVQVRSGGAVLMPTRVNSREQQVLPGNTFIARMWRPSPRYHQEPDSSMVGVADSVNELLMLMRLVRGAARSRMNAGLLFIPDGIASAKSTTTGEPPLEEPEDSIEALAGAATEDPGGPFLTQLMESMTTPIADEASASTVVPMLATGPGELGAMIKHVTFERHTDEWLVKRADQALDRVLQGIDIPKEIVTGLEAVKFSNAVVITEDLFRSNIEPLALAFVDSLTDVYLRPVLKSDRYGYTDEDLADIVVWYNPSEIVTRPNSADEATQGVDRLLLSPAAWRREHGYAESDAPSEDELAMMLLHKLRAVPDVVVVKLLKQALPGVLEGLDESVSLTPTGKEDTHVVVPFPGPQQPEQPAQPVPDPQRVAIQQVGGQK